MKDAIVAALDAVCEDYSPDRVVADPAMNSAFVRECTRLGLTHSPLPLNRSLLNLRKRGLLRGRKSKKTSFPNQADYSFAAEMAVRFLERRDGVSLDEIICDPERVQEFDDLAGEIAPGHSPLQYRWAALSLRKASRLKPELLSKVVELLRVTSFRADQIDLSRIPAEQGLYLFYTTTLALYAGETESRRGEGRRRRIAFTYSCAAGRRSRICGT